MQDQHVTWLVSLQLKDLSGPPFWKQLTWGSPLSPRTFSNSLAGNPESPKWGTSRELQGLARPARTRSARVKNSTNVIKKYNCHTRAVLNSLHEDKHNESVFWKRLTPRNVFTASFPTWYVSPSFARLSHLQTHCDSFCSFSDLGEIESDQKYVPNKNTRTASESRQSAKIFHRCIVCYHCRLYSKTKPL